MVNTYIGRSLNKLFKMTDGLLKAYRELEEERRVNPESRRINALETSYTNRLELLKEHLKRLNYLDGLDL